MKKTKKYIVKYIKNIITKKNRVMITGFQGFGAVGYLAPRYMVSKLSMELIGYIEPPIFPDFTSIEDYGFSMPHEIFIKSLGDRDIVVLLNRVNPDRRYMDSYLDSIVKIILDLNIEEVFLIGGLDSRFREREEEYRWFKTSSNPRNIEAPYFMKGAYIVGPLASLLLYLENSRIPAIVLLPYTEPESVDHKAAAIAIKAISKLLNFDIDVNELLSYAEKVEELEKMLQKLYLQHNEKKESIMHT